jgi:hypothetical protein
LMKGNKISSIWRESIWKWNIWGWTTELE